MRRAVMTVVATLAVILAAACGSGPPDPDNTMGPGMMGDDMRVAAVDSTLPQP